jgi:MYND finger
MDAGKSVRCAAPQRIYVKRCTGCKVVFYCSVEHQKQDRKKHKAFCKSIQQGKSPEAAAAGGSGSAARPANPAQPARIVVLRRKELCHRTT